MGTIDDKIYSDQKEKQIVYTREWIDEKVLEFLKRKQITVLPPCAFSTDAEPMSVIRRKIEKRKNFGDDVKT